MKEKTIEETVRKKAENYSPITEDLANYYDVKLKKFNEDAEKIIDSLDLNESTLETAYQGVLYHCINREIKALNKYVFTFTDEQIESIVTSLRELRREKYLSNRTRYNNLNDAANGRNGFREIGNSEIIVYLLKGFELLNAYEKSQYSIPTKDRSRKIESMITHLTEAMECTLNGVTKQLLQEEINILQLKYDHQPKENIYRHVFFRICDTLKRDPHIHNELNLGDETISSIVNNVIKKVYQLPQNHKHYEVTTETMNIKFQFAYNYVTYLTIYK